MSRKVLFSSADTADLIAWVQNHIAIALNDSEYRQVLEHFRQELTSVRFRVAKRNTYQVEIVKRGNKISLEVLNDTRQVVNIVDGILIDRRYWLFGEYTLTLDPEYDAHD